jgi:hypothetical protein
VQPRSEIPQMRAPGSGVGTVNARLANVW